MESRNPFVDVDDTTTPLSADRDVELEEASSVLVAPSEASPSEDTSSEDSPLSHEDDSSAFDSEVKRVRRKRARRVARAVYFALCIFSLLVGLPLGVYALACEHVRARAYLLPVASVFVGCAVPIASWGIARHALAYWQPTLQIYVVRILWMVPVYSLTSWFELFLWLRWPESADQLALLPSSVRDCYEAYTVYNFMQFMLVFLEVDSGVVADKHLWRARLCANANASPTVRHLPFPPYRFWLPARFGGGYDALADWRVDTPQFVQQCRKGVLLYVTVMPVCAAVQLLGGLLSLGSDQQTLSLKDPWAAVTSVSNWAALLRFCAANHAIYCLGLFFYVAHDVLAPCAPHAKFVAVKGLVFGTFFQGLALQMVFALKPALVVAFEPQGAPADDDAARAGAQRAAYGATAAALLCVEMLAFAVLHAKAFPPSEFGRVTEPTGGRAYLVAWGEFYATHRAERRARLWSGSPADSLATSLLFDVRDVHADTTATWNAVGRDVQLVQQRLMRDDSLLGRAADHVVAAVRAPRVALSRWTRRQTGGVNL